MPTRILFPVLRLIMFVLPGLAQLYLFLRVRKAILSSGRSDRFKGPAVGFSAFAMASLFAMNGFILFVPLNIPDLRPAAGAVLFYLPSIWAFGSILSAFLLLLVGPAHALARAALRPFRPQTGCRPHNPGRRRFLRTGMAGLATAPFILSGYGAAIAAKTCEVREIEAPFGRSLRVVQLSDIHAGLYMTREEIRRYVDRVIALRPELLVLTGDFISNSMSFMSSCLEEMTRVRTRYGTFAVPGNHERWYGTHREVNAAFRKHGIPLLVNGHRVIPTGQGPFAVAGIDDLRTGHPQLGTALAGLDPALPTLLLSHRPEVFPQAAACGIPLTLAGHWHGGQVKLVLPGVVLSLAHIRTPYPEGLFRIGASLLYVSRGIGTTFTPVRLNAPPEITVIHLKQC